MKPFLTLLVNFSSCCRNLFVGFSVLVAVPFVIVGGIGEAFIKSLRKMEPSVFNEENLAPGSLILLPDRNQNFRITKTIGFLPDGTLLVKHLQGIIFLRKQEISILRLMGLVSNAGNQNVSTDRG